MICDSLSSFLHHKHDEIWSFLQIKLQFQSPAKGNFKEKCKQKYGSPRLCNFPIKSQLGWGPNSNYPSKKISNFSRKNIQKSRTFSIQTNSICLHLIPFNFRYLLQICRPFFCFDSINFLFSIFTFLFDTNLLCKYFKRFFPLFLCRIFSPFLLHNIIMKSFE